MSDHIGWLRKMASLCSDPVNAERWLGAAAEIERLQQLSIDRAGTIIELNDAMALQGERDGDEIARLTSENRDLSEIQARDSERIERLAGEVARLKSRLDAETRMRITLERENRRLEEEVANPDQRLLEAGDAYADLQRELDMANAERDDALASTTRRIDRAGRDVTDLPGLWDESDRTMTAVELGEEVGRLMAEVEQRTDVARELQRLLWIASPVDGNLVKKTWPWLSDTAAPAARSER